MHLTPSDLKATTRRALRLRAGTLGPVVALLTELPATGSAGTTLEHLCTQAHWAVVLGGELELRRGRERWEIQSGEPFYVPPGSPKHSFFAPRRTIVAGFSPLDDEQVQQAERNGEVQVSRRIVEPPQPGEIRAETSATGPWVMTRTLFGSTSGFGNTWCDLPHWGIVLGGGIVIEYEHDVEMLGAGDFFYCPHGPPSHKIEVADVASIVDFTPRDAIASAEHVSSWRADAGVLLAAR